MLPPIAGIRSPSRSNNVDPSTSPSRKAYERPSTKTPEFFQGFACSRNSFSNLTLRTPAACGFQIPIAEPFTIADDLLNGFTRPSFLTRLENRRSASVENILTRSEQSTNSQTMAKLKQHRVKSSLEFAREAQQLISEIKDARSLKSTFTAIQNAELVVEIREPVDKSLPSIEDLKSIDTRKLIKKRPTRAERVNEKLNVYRYDPEARESLSLRNMENKTVCAREILDRNICIVRSLSPEVRRERIAQQAYKATEHRDDVLKNYTELHEKLHTHWLNEPQNRILRLKEEAKRAKMAHYNQVFNAFYMTVKNALAVTDMLQLIRTNRIRKNSELFILNWVRRWKVKKRVKSVIIIQRCHGAFHKRRQNLHKSAEIIKFVLKNSKIAIMAKNALDRMRGRMVEVRARWRVNRAVRWFKYRVIMYQLTMYDAERLRRIRELGKTHQNFLKEKAVSSVSAIIHSSSVQPGSSQLQTFVTALSHASNFISAGLRNPKSLSNLPAYAYGEVLMNCKTFKSLKKDAFEVACYSSEASERHLTLAAMHQVAYVMLNKLIVKHRENLIQYRKAMAAFILKTENAVDLEVAKLHLFDHASINSENLRSQIRRRLFSSSIPMRPWFPLSLPASDLKVMLQESLIVQRKLVSILQTFRDLYFVTSYELQNRHLIKPMLGLSGAVEPETI